VNKDGINGPVRNNFKLILAIPPRTHDVRKDLGALGLDSRLADLSRRSRRSRVMEYL